MTHARFVVQKITRKLDEGVLVFMVELRPEFGGAGHIELEIEKQEAVEQFVLGATYDVDFARVDQ